MGLCKTTVRVFLPEGGPVGLLELLPEHVLGREVVGGDAVLVADRQDDGGQLGQQLLLLPVLA